MIQDKITICAKSWGYQGSLAMWSTQDDGTPNSQTSGFAAT
jgi:hypothetical protein